jgi:hypothetical protein
MQGDGNPKNPNFPEVKTNDARESAISEEIQLRSAGNQ